jgi:hypothetical protein
VGGKRGKMTQTLYAHMNIIKKEEKKTDGLAKLTHTTKQIC